MSTKIVVLFPYSGYDKDSQQERLFKEIIRCCKNTTNSQRPLVVLNRDTERRGKADAFLADAANLKNVTLHRTWSVDTCQMWLSGWGEIIDDPHTSDNDRIVQLPGDYTGQDTFFKDLEAFIDNSDMSSCDIIIGDFFREDKFNPKELIDLYGTYALIANWFPDAAMGIRKLRLNKPRSGFLNMRVGVLKELLALRKFAYEQTLNLLIRSWDFTKREWKYKVGTKLLGVINDEVSLYGYSDCLDQIERTERMLKLLWREIHEQQPMQVFIAEYDRLDRRSTSIRENARIIIRNSLGLKQN